MTNNSNLSQAHADAGKSKFATIRVIVGAPSAGKTVVAEKRSAAQIDRDPIICNGPHTQSREMLIKEASAAGRAIIVDSDSIASSLSSIEYGKTLSSKELIVEAVFSPMVVSTKRVPNHFGIAHVRVAERNAALQFMATAASMAERFELTCNSSNHMLPQTVAIAQNGNVRFVDNARVALMIDHIRREGPAVVKYLKAHNIPEVRISKLMEEHRLASAAACSFFNAILQGQKIKPVLQPAL